MKNNIGQFLESLKNPNTVRVAESILKNVDNNENIEQYNLEELKQFILNLKPNSPKAIITTCYVLGLYAKWLKEEGVFNSDNFYLIIQSVDKSNLWKNAKQNAPSKFISYNEYKETIHNIEMYEEFNSLYYETLLQCIYEGVYSDDMSVIKNLSLSDIKNENIVLLRKDDGNSYEFEVTSELIKKLKELTAVDIWERKNRNGICKIAISGEELGSCFKLEKRTSIKEDSYKFSYYARLRKISKEYFERNILPFSIFVSGIMHRIKCELEQNGIALVDAFSDNNRNRLVGSIISNELQRCHYNIEVRNFREIVKGHIDIFAD